MMFRAVFWVVLPCKMIVDNHFTRQYNPEDSSEHYSNAVCDLVQSLETPYRESLKTYSKTASFHILTN